MAPRAVFLDVELSRRGKLHGLAAIGPDGEEAVAKSAAEVPGTLDRIAAWDAELLVGHNLARHDRPWLVSVAPAHPALRLPWVDTLVLSPLLFPERPYHRLLKEERLVRDCLPAPLADCRATRVLLDDEIAAAARLAPPLRAYAAAALADPRTDGGNPGYAAVLGAADPADDSPSRSAGRGPAPLHGRPSGALLPALLAHLDGHACGTALARLRPDPAEALAFCWLAAWLLVPPGSTLPAWVLGRSPSVRQRLHELRDVDCGACAWCRRAHSPEGWLAAMFGYSAFRPAPPAPDGGSLQRAIVAAGMAERPLHAVLPTGTGKSLCFQIPAAARHRRTGALTVAISPLQSLMKDQVDQLRSRDPHAATVHGSLTLPERARALAEVTEGFTSLLYVSPEQLRNPGVRRALAARTIGAWVIDEAHCLTEWGHDFRPDFQYVPRFARELAAARGVPVAPFQCFTGTSQQHVTASILGLLRREVQQELLVFDGGAERENLTFRVETCPKPDKPARLQALLDEHLEAAGAAVVFCATRGEADRTALLLRDAGWEAARYHAGLDSQARRDVQDAFLSGALRVIAATSAFGMGVDKPDVRLVVHLEPPGSLEAYLQQAGRAGRDQEPATCVLLFEPGDLDHQLRLATHGNVTLADLRALWRGVQRVPAKRAGATEERVVTRGELARLDAVRSQFPPDDAATDARLTTAVSWLERAGLFQRDENHTAVFQGRPRIASLEAALARVQALNLSPTQDQAWRRILARLYEVEADAGLSADDLAELAGEGDAPVGAGSRVLETLRQMVEAGLVQGGVSFTAFVAWGVPDPTVERAARLVQQQNALLAALPVLTGGEEVYAADTGRGARTSTPRLVASPERLAEHLRTTDELEVVPERIRLLLRALERDGQGLSAEERSLDVRFHRDALEVRARRPWGEIARLGKLRGHAVTAVTRLLDARAAKAGQRGSSVLIAFDQVDLVHALETWIPLHGAVRSAPALVEQTLLLLHDTRVLTLQGGLTVFRQAMVLRRPPDATPHLRREQVAPLFDHQEERVLQAHVVAEYARRGAADIAEARSMTRDWFEEPRDLFLRRWFAGRRDTLRRPTSPASYEQIVGQLDEAQQRVVTAPADKNVLVLAGPGAGKTRVLVHRVAWLLRVARVRAQGILVLCYTRANALELRRRLAALVDEDARGVTVTTMHGLALRLRGGSAEDVDFGALLTEATAVLQGARATDGVEAEEARELALRGATHLLVDEYQDLDDDQVALLEAITGRALDAGQRLGVTAVGDDDQAIFGWRGGSPGRLRSFAEGWQAEQVVLTACHRCPAPVLGLAGAVIAPVPGRLKEGVALVAQHDGEPVHVHAAVPDELGGAVASLLAGADEGGVAVLARTRATLAPVRAALEARGIPVAWPLAHDERLPLHQLREVVLLADRLEAGRGTPDRLVSVAELRGWIAPAGGPWTALLERWCAEVEAQHGATGTLGEILARALRTAVTLERGERVLPGGPGEVRLGTLHGAKGLEWPRVILVDDGRSEGGRDGEAEARRLWYVGLARASRRLDLVLPAGRASAVFREVARSATPLPGAAAPSARYEVLGLDELWIDALGRARSAAGVAVLDTLPFGAAVTLEVQGERAVLVAQGVVIGILTRAAAEVWAPRRPRLRLVGVVRRTRAQSDPAYQPALVRDRWWVPVCEGAWAPG